MTRRIPSSALLLGLAGLIPFLWGASSSAQLLLDYMPGEGLPSPFIGTAVLVSYGTIILCFMAGAIWGFAARAPGPFLPIGLVLSVVPPLWIFFFTASDTSTQLVALIIGFIALLPIDYACARKALAPEWWMPLRLLLTTVVVFCLAIGFLLAP